MNGFLLSLGTYRGHLAYNQEQASLAKALTGPFRTAPGTLVVAGSQTVDDSCGWIYTLTQNQVLFCTDAEIMLTPQQDLEIHRFRQAIYLYLNGQGSDSLRRSLAGEHSLGVLYYLGYWAEAASLSPQEHADGVRAVEHELIPWVERVEHHDEAVANFFRQFPRIVVVDNAGNPTFSDDRLDAFLKLQSEQHADDVRLRTYTAR